MNMVWIAMIVAVGQMVSSPADTQTTPMEDSLYDSPVVVTDEAEPSPADSYTDGLCRVWRQHADQYCVEFTVPTQHVQVRVDSYDGVPAQMTCTTVGGQTLQAEKVLNGSLGVGVSSTMLASCCFDGGAFSELQTY